MHFLAGLTHPLIEELGYLQMPKLKGSQIRRLMPSKVRILDDPPPLRERPLLR